MYSYHCCKLLLDKGVIRFGCIHVLTTGVNSWEKLYGKIDGVELNFSFSKINSLHRIYKDDSTTN